MRVPLSSPDITQDEREAVAEVLSSPVLSLGPKLPAFEASIAAFTGARHAVALNSGASGLHLAVKAAGIEDGDEVITTPFSFVASANCILFERGVPVFVDIDPVTLNIDPQRIEPAITAATKAILPVHVFGRPCKMRSILEIADRRGLAVIEDACEALGARYHGECAGRFGQSGVFAFYPNKQMTTGEGGVLITDDDRIARLCRSWRNQGRSDAEGWLEHERIGYNYRLSELNCALGIAQLRRLPWIVAQRRRVARLYDEALRSLTEVIPPPLDEPASEVSWFVYVVRLADDFDQQQRDEILSELTKHGVGCRNYFPPIHLQPLYVKEFGFRKGMFPIAEQVSERTIALPFFNRLSESEIGYVCARLRAAIKSTRRRSSVAFSVSA